MKCSFETCDREVRCKGFCKSHYSQFLRTGTVREINFRGKGTMHRGYHYLYKQDHPNAEKGGRIAEHRFVMSEMLGRPLLPFENVHHKNGIKLDNSPENLELWVTKQPYGQRPEDLVKWARQILNLYSSLVDNTNQSS